MVKQRKLHIILHKQHGDYNTGTSVYIGLINPRCTEIDLIEELNLILRDERLKRDKELAQNKDKIVKSNVNPEVE